MITFHDVGHLGRRVESGPSTSRRHRRVVKILSVSHPTHSQSRSARFRTLGPTTRPAPPGTHQQSPLPRQRTRTPVFQSHHLLITLCQASLNATFEPELTLLLQLTLYKLSVWNTGASYGAKLQDLRYFVPSPPANTSLARSYTDFIFKLSVTSFQLPASGLPRLILLIHGTLSTILPYLHTRLRSHALSSAWPDAPTADRRRKMWDLLISIESSYTFLSLANFIAFLWNGRSVSRLILLKPFSLVYHRFRSIADRLLSMSLAPSRRQVTRDISYEFMNRQMVWHAFTVCHLLTKHSQD